MMCRQGKFLNSLDRGLSESVRGDIEIEYDDEEMDSF